VIDFLIYTMIGMVVGLCIFCTIPILIYFCRMSYLKAELNFDSNNPPKRGLDNVKS